MILSLWATLFILYIHFTDAVVCIIKQLEYVLPVCFSRAYSIYIERSLSGAAVAESFGDEGM